MLIYIPKKKISADIIFKRGAFYAGMTSIAIPDTQITVLIVCGRESSGPY
jgi:hypothetical protein